MGFLVPIAWTSVFHRGFLLDETYYTYLRFKNTHNSKAGDVLLVSDGI